MPVVSPPPRLSRFRGLVKPAIVVVAIVGVIIFLRIRFGETSIEKAERLFQKGLFQELRTFTQNKLTAGEKEISPVLMSYYAVAEFTTNPKASLHSLLGAIAAVDARTIFRRESLERIWLIQMNRRRAGEILPEVLALETPIGQSVKNLADEILTSEVSLAGSSETLFADLLLVFPRASRRVSAKALQMRTAPTTDAEVIRRLETGEQLILRRTLGQTTVSGKKGRWAFVLDSNLNSGWVFDAYLSTPTRKTDP